MLRPMRSLVVSAGSRNSTKNTTTAKTERVLNCRLRYAEAPSWTAAAISFILSVPSSAARTSRARMAATTRAASAMTATMTTSVRLVPVNSIMGLLSVGTVTNDRNAQESTQRP